MRKQRRDDGYIAECARRMEYEQPGRVKRKRNRKERGLRKAIISISCWSFIIQVRILFTNIRRYLSCSLKRASNVISLHPLKLSKLLLATLKQFLFLHCVHNSHIFVSQKSCYRFSCWVPSFVFLFIFWRFMAVQTKYLLSSLFTKAFFPNLHSRAISISSFAISFNYNLYSHPFEHLSFFATTSTWGTGPAGKIEARRELGRILAVESKLFFLGRFEQPFDGLVHSDKRCLFGRIGSSVRCSAGSLIGR